MRQDERIDAVVYSSHAADGLTDTELELILIGSQTLNALRAVTGVLLKSDHSIVQYLEGPGPALQRTLMAIQRSTLHHGVRILSHVQNVPRHFLTWHMGFGLFQRQHGRMEAHEAWIDALPSARREAQENPALAALLDAWDDLGIDAPVRY
jgi:hypothetical protein